MYYFSAKTIKCALEWITFAYWLPGMVICTTLFVLSRSTHVNIFEEQPGLSPRSGFFTKSPNLSKIGATTANESPAKENKGLKTIYEKDADTHGLETNGVPKSAGAVLLLNEIVTKAASAANNSRLQRDFNSIKF